MARHADAAPAGSILVPPGLARAVAAARAHAPDLLALPGVIAVRGGYKFVDGMITTTPAVVVAVDRKRDDVPAAQRIPATLPDGTPTDVTPADPIERLAAARSNESAGAPVARVAPSARLLIDQLAGWTPSAPMDDAMAEAVRPITYRPPPGALLGPVTGAMAITCHVAPDAGWRVLRGFLREARQRISLGIYDFTAPHIYRYVRQVLRDRPVTWRQTVGPHEHLTSSSNGTKADDKTEASVIRGLSRVAGPRFESAFAKVGSGRTFASAYHIKVAVRDASATWLSSGNWQSSNVPVTDFLRDGATRNGIRRYNREWNVVVEHEGLARTFERFLDHDFETAQVEEELPALAEAPMPDLLAPPDWLEPEAPPVPLEVFAPARLQFPADDPLTIQPLLTPDNYAEAVIELLRERPRERLYVQNQSLNPVLDPTPAWRELLRLLAEHSTDPDLDVRIIVRRIGPIRKRLESLQAIGFDMRRVRTQVGCHTKGLVIDSSTLLLGSHNWTDEGIQANRDASLLIRRPEIAAYYERVFLHDWERLARPAIVEEAQPVPIVGGDDGLETPDRDGEASGWQRIPWSAWEDD